MGSEGIATLIASIAALLTALAALINSRNSKDVCDKLRREVDTLKEQRTQLLQHNEYQDALLLDREKQVGRLTAKLKQWQDSYFELGRMVNQMQLQIGYLQQRAGVAIDATQPLPKLPGRDDG